MNVDLHTHTYPASDCSHISFREYVAWCVTHGVEAVALTNHGDVADNRELEPALAAEGVLLVHGVEISTLFGDFVDLLAGPRLPGHVRAPCRTSRARGEVPDDAAVVWVHPAAGGGRSGSAYYPGLERMVAGVVDAVEVYNGSWLGDALRHGAPSDRRTARRWRAPAAAMRTRPGSSWPATRSCPTPCARPPTSSTALKQTASPSRTVAQAARRQRRSASSRRPAMSALRRPDRPSAWSFVDVTARWRPRRRGAACATAPCSSSCRTPPPA